MTRKPRRKRGKPPVLTPELQSEIVKRLLVGNYIEMAAASVGVAKRYIYEWLKRGAEVADGKIESPTKHDLQCLEFNNAVKKAMADAETFMLSVIQRAAQDGVWQAAAWRLERRAPQRWGHARSRYDDETETPETAMPLEVASLADHIAFLLDILRRRLDGATYEAIREELLMAAGAPATGSENTMLGASAATESTQDNPNALPSSSAGSAKKGA